MQCVQIGMVSGQSVQRKPKRKRRHQRQAHSEAQDDHTARVDINSDIGYILVGTSIFPYLLQFIKEKMLIDVRVVPDESTRRLSFNPVSDELQDVRRTCTY